MSVQLRLMGDEEFAAWFPRACDGYAAAMVRDGGFSPERATATAAAVTEKLLPGGRPSPEQSVFVIEADGERVGNLWLGERDDPPGLFVYDIEVDERHRGRGYGKAAMLLAEEEARRRGLEAIALNVFGGNSVARALYQSLGYVENAVFMSKSV